MKPLYDILLRGNGQQWVLRIQDDGGNHQHLKDMVTAADSGSMVLKSDAALPENGFTI